MDFDLEKTLEEIKSHPLFLRLKDVVENSEGWHDQETVYDHLIKTANHAKEFSRGGFITNPEAKEEFISWMNEDFHGMKKSDRAVLTGLLHDSGKILCYKEGEKEKSLIKDINGQTSCPGHEYWGGRLVVPEILKEIQIPNEAKRDIAEVVKLHDSFNKFFKDKKDWPIKELISDAKATANGYYQEALFNSYVDCYDAPNFQYDKGKIEEIFNQPSFYIPRKYFLP